MLRASIVVGDPRGRVRHSREANDRGKIGWETRKMRRETGMLVLAAGAALWLGGRTAALAGTALAGGSAPVQLPNGQYLTPEFATGSVLQTLDPHLPGYKNFRAGWAIRTALSPDGRTLLVLTSGYNRLNFMSGASRGQGNPAASNEYVFVFDVAGANARKPVQKQVLQIPNSFYGLVWAPDGQHFYVSGGVSDAVFVFGQAGTNWAQTATVVLNHPPLSNNLTGAAKLLSAFLFNGLGFISSSAAAGLAITPDGSTLVVANIYNDSISVIDTASNTVRWEYDLRPYNNTPELSGTAGGEMPYGVAIAPTAAGGYTAFVSSVRDREVVAVPLRSIPPDGGTLQRIKLPGNPNSMALSADGTRLYVAQDNSDFVAIIDTQTLGVAAELDVLPVHGLLDIGHTYTGAAPNGLALSPDGKTLYVSEGGANAVAVINVAVKPPAPVAQIPTGWYPHSVSLSADGTTLYVANGKSDPGPDPQSIPAARNQYIEQLVQGGLLSLPVPASGDYAALTAQVTANNGYKTPETAHDRRVMAALHAKIQHIIYIIKENRTFDQVLGDLGNGSNGDPSLTQWKRSITPSLHEAALHFVTLDNFYCAGEVSANGWPWSTGAREADYGVTTVPLDYAGRGFQDDSAGMNRIVNVSLDLADRIAAYPTVSGIGNIYEVLSSAMPGGTANLLPGFNDDFATDGPWGTPQQTGNIWDSALRAGLTVRNYGFKDDIVRYNIPFAIGGIPYIENPFASGTQVAWPANPTLAPYTDIYFRGFDNAFPDTWRWEEWNREFQQYVANGNLPSFEFVRFMHDHTGNFCPKPYTDPTCPAAGLNTPELQQADNDYSVGKLLESVANSPYAGNTLVFVVEDDAQAGEDHVDAHRTTAYVVGPYVKHKAIVSAHYNTVNMLRTMEEIMGLQPLNLNDAHQPPMTDVFDVNHSAWSFHALASPLLKHTGLNTAATQYVSGPGINPDMRPTHDQDWWAQRTRGYDWSSEDKIPAGAYNRTLWEGMKGTPYPGTRGATTEADGD
jgi:YVTN family beta-propeller protein